MASEIATNYDPFGTLAPIILIPKCIQQELWKDNLGWDEAIPNHILAKWCKWIDEFHCVERLSIPRALLRAQPPTTIELHVFSDASEKGYSAVVYLRTVYEDSDPSVSFALAWSRVAPAKHELMGAVVAVRLVLELKRSLQFKIDHVCFWSDSKTVLQWINSKTCKFDTFVENRISEILDISRKMDWRHVPGALNPADDVSRGLLPSELANEHLWFTGFAFFKESQPSWPENIASRAEGDAAYNWIGLVKAESNPTLIDSFESFLSRSSRFTRVRRAVAFILRFVQFKERV